MVLFEKEIRITPIVLQDNWKLLESRHRISLIFVPPLPRTNVLHKVKLNRCLLSEWYRLECIAWMYSRMKAVLELNIYQVLTTHHAPV